MYTMKYTYQIWKETQMKMYGWTINIHGPSRPNYHIPPLTKCLPLGNSQQTHVYAVGTY